MIDFFQKVGLPYNTVIVLAGVSLLGASSGMIGAFAVLRQRALTGDALSHASLPGLCLAYLLVGERNLPAMLVGAFLAGMVGIAIIVLIRRWTRIKEDAAIGMVLGVFFGAGLVLLTMILHRPGGSPAGLDSFILGKTASMSLADVQLVAGLAAGTGLLVLLFYKEFKVVAFDPAFARVQGWPTFFLDMFLMTLIAVAVVVGLPAVGVILMAALLIMPSVAARFWTDRLGRLLGLSGALGLAMGASGALLSDYWNLPAGPAIILVGAGMVVFSALAAPRRGILARAREHNRFRQELKKQLPGHYSGSSTTL